MNTEYEFIKHFCTIIITIISIIIVTFIVMCLSRLSPFRQTNHQKLQQIDINKDHYKGLIKKEKSRFNRTDLHHLSDDVNGLGVEIDVEFIARVDDDVTTQWCRIILDL